MQTANIRERVYARSVAELYKLAPVGIIAALINASVLSLILWGLIPHATLVAWLAATILAAAFRFFLIKQFNTSAAGIEDARMWCRRYIAGLGLSGILWGSSALFLFPTESTAHQAVIAFVLAGMVAGAVGAFSSIFPAFLAFMLPALCPILVRFFMIRDDIHYAMAAMTLLFMVLMLLTARRINLSNRELIELKEHFADQVEERTREIEEVNEALVREIEEREHAEAVWENTFNAISDWISIIDRDFTIQSTNRAGEELLGLPKEDIVGKKCFKLVHGLDEPAPECPVSRMLESGERGVAEIQSPQGIWLMVTVDPMINPDGKFAGAVHTVRDVTARKLADAALKESEEKFRAITQSARDAIYCKDAHGRYTFVNPIMEELLDRSAPAIMGKTAKDFFFPEDAEIIEKADRKTLRGDTVQTAQAIRIQQEERIFNVIQVPLWDGNGKVVGLSGIARDITQAKRLEAQLQHAGRMEAISTLAGGIAHQFNNALSGITANLDLLEFILGDKQDLKRNLESMKEASFRMSRLTSQLLAYARGGKYQAKVLSLNDFVNDTITLLQHRIPPAVHLDVQLLSGVPRVNADSTQLQMVLSAVLDNSIEALEGRGRIRISTFIEDLDKESANLKPGFTPGVYACLQVEDDGKGMNEETRKRVFEPFYSTKFLGRGLGLAAVYGIVKNHDGYVSLDSEPDKGTIISIYLPAENDPEAPPLSSP